MRRARYYNKTSNRQIHCKLCRHFCIIDVDRTGLCGVRRNIDGILYSLNYGKIVARQNDPIEKKPLNYFLPGTFTYSIACFGCNLRCLYCQNAQISQLDGKNFLEFEKLPETEPAEIVSAAIAAGCPSISYTYSEPTIFAEFALDIMTLARQKGLKNIWVSNGYMSNELLNDILPFLDAANIDLKFFRPKSYLEIAGAKLGPILENLIAIRRFGVHLEITTLVVPGVNDSIEELEQIAAFILEKLSPDTPWHLNAFYPTYKFADQAPTPKTTLIKARQIGQKMGLKNIVLGNI